MTTARNTPAPAGRPAGDADALPETATGTTAHVPSKRPAARLAGPYGHPFHPQLVTLPIGAFVASLIFDIIARLGYVDVSGAAFAAAWLLVIGCAGAVVAAVFGIMDLTTIPDGTRASRVGVAHGTINAVATVVLGFGAATRFSRGLDQVSDLSFALSIAGLLVLGLGGWLGGKLAYTYGVRVARETSQDRAYRH